MKLRLFRVEAASGDEWGGTVGGKMRILNDKFYFVHVTIFKCLSQMKGNSKVFKFKIPVRGGYCTYRPTAPKKTSNAMDVRVRIHASSRFACR